MAWEGAIGVSGPAETGCVGSSRFLSYRAIENVNLRYVNYLFQGPSGRQLISNASTGSTARNKTLSIDALEKISIKLPPIEEQNRIADKMDALLRHAESVQELRYKCSDLHGRLRESLIDSLAGKAPETAKLGDLITLERTPVSINSAATYQTVGVRSFGRGFIHHPPAKGADLSKLNYFRFRAGALTLSNLMAWEGGITVTRSEDTTYIASNRFFFYTPTDSRMNVSYLRHYLLSRRGKALIATACSAGAERNRTLGRKRFEALVIPLPPRTEQDKVARILDSLAERMDRAHSNPTLGSLRPSILNAAFTGQL